LYSDYIHEVQNAKMLIEIELFYRALKLLAIPPFSLIKSNALKVLPLCVRLYASTSLTNSGISQSASI